MTKVDFAIRGNAAFSVLRRHVETFGARTIGRVQVSSDPDMADDAAHEVLEWCSTEDINRGSAGDVQVGNNYCFYINWPVKPPSNSRNIILHEGLLPRFRGSAPLINSLISGEREIGVTALLATGENDEGPVIAQEKILIDYPLTIGEAIQKVTHLTMKIVSSIYTNILSGKDLVTSEQDHYLATYCLALHASDYEIDWHKPAEVIKRTIDALGPPYKGVMAKVDGRSLAITGARIVGDVVIENRTPGKVLFIQDGIPVVVCSSGLIAISAATFSDTGETLVPVNNLKLLFH